MPLPLYALHNPGVPFQLKFGELELTAFSISGVATYVLVPSLKACFDLGHCAVEASHFREVFLSHVHQDHAAGVFRHNSLRRMFGMGPSHVYVPEESRDDLIDLFRAWNKLERREAEPYEEFVFPVRAGETLNISKKYSVQCFDVVHRIASRGYTVLERRKKLKSEYHGLPGIELGKLHEKGEELYDYTEHFPFTYVGDSTAETLRRNPQLGRSEVLFLEVTHLPGTPFETSARWGHTHLEELAMIEKEQPETLASPHIVLKHFSTRYSREEILDAVNKVLPSSLRKRVTVLV